MIFYLPQHPNKLFLSCLDTKPFQLTIRVDLKHYFLLQLSEHQVNNKTNQNNPISK